MAYRKKHSNTGNEGRSNVRGDRRSGIRPMPVVDVGALGEAPQSRTEFGPNFSAAKFFEGTGVKDTSNPKRHSEGNKGARKES